MDAFLFVYRPAAHAAAQRARDHRVTDRSRSRCVSSGTISDVQAALGNFKIDGVTALSPDICEYHYPIVKF